MANIMPDKKYSTAFSFNIDDVVKLPLHYLHEKEIPLEHVHILTVFNRAKQYEITFDVAVMSVSSAWASFVHFTIGGNRGQCGDRVHEKFTKFRPGRYLGGTWEVSGSSQLPAPSSKLQARQQL